MTCNNLPATLTITVGSIPIAEIMHGLIEAPIWTGTPRNVEATIPEEYWASWGIASPEPEEPSKVHWQKEGF
jgi:hypothetical protein